MNFFLHIRSKSFRQTGEIANLKPYSLKLWKFGRFISSIAPPPPPQPAPAQPIPPRRPPLKSPSIFVIGLPQAATMDKLKSVFGVYGNIKSANFYPPKHVSEENDDENRKSTHKCAFIHYYKLRDAEYARKEMHFMFFDGSVIFVDPVAPRGPPKGGGGATKGSGEAVANVARLKGGDPLVFGRGGEEMDILQQQGIEVKVIPGPGDPELLTTKGLRVIENADLLLYDRLVSNDVLNLVGPNANLLYASKTTGYHSRTQEEIHELLLSFAEAGANVVRLKGGDPLVFGRGGEEMDILQQQGIEVKVIPGITAASGVAAELGIPLTHRGVANSVRFLTGHSQKGGTDPLFVAVNAADPKSTIVVYMGLSTLPCLASKSTIVIWSGARSASLHQAPILCCE